MANKIAKINLLAEKYKKFVVNNHGFVGNIEAGFKILSYFSPGRGEHSAVISELIYSAANLLVFVNDAILRQAADIKLRVPLPHKELCKWLGILEHIEVFLEIAALGFSGECYRWAAIVCVQIAKATIRLILLLKYNSGIQQTPPIPGLKRDQVLQKRLDDVKNAKTDARLSDNGQPELKQTYTLSSSGRSVRTLDSAPPLLQRTWRVPTQSETPLSTGCMSTVLTRAQMLGECLHITRPLGHLLSMYIHGVNAWRPWLLASGMDLSSVYLLGDKYQYNKPECDELRRRHILMILYMLRSPFYDKYTKERLLKLLETMAAYIPGIRLIIRPLLDYLPWWQKVYFYVWMT